MRELDTTLVDDAIDGIEEAIDFHLEDNHQAAINCLDEVVDIITQAVNYLRDTYGVEGGDLGRFIP